MKKETVLTAIENSGGIVNTVAKKLDCNWNTARKYINEWEETKIAFQDEKEKIIDMAEGVIYNSVKEGNSQDAKWILSTLGKNRGFSEKHELQHSGEIGSYKLNKEERKKRIKELEERRGVDRA